MPSSDAAIGAKATLDDVLAAVRKLSDEVMEMRAIVVPISWRHRAFILGASCLAGTIVANVSLWLTYHETVLVLLHPH